VIRRPAGRQCRRFGAAVALIALVAVLHGCGGGDAAGDKIPGRTLTIYSSGPLEGLSSFAAQAVLRGEQLALAIEGGRIGKYRIVLRSLDDATLQRGGWDPGQTTTNARLVAADPTTIGYLGDFNSGASAISIPLLNRNGIAQISPTSTAVGLTSSAAGSSPGEPAKYYPTGRRTFARVMPSDTVQSSAQVELQQSMGCKRTFVLDDGEVDGSDAAASFSFAAQRAHLPIAGLQAFDPRATTYPSLATAVGQSGADCVLISAAPENHAALVTEQVAAALPHALLFGWSGLAQNSYTDPTQGGIPVSLDPRVLLTGAVLSAGGYPVAARRFLATYRREFGEPQPYAICGAEAMNLVLSAIVRATRHGRSAALRSKVAHAIFATLNLRSVLGTYSINSDGDTTLRRYGVYRVVDGRLAVWTNIVPSPEGS
jgi:branched-chain amino acid transport system substrate-binding protein